MAKTYSVNATPATGALAMYQLIAAMVAAGWTKVKDSDGTTYSAAGTQVTGGASGAHGLDNASAWVLMQDPGAARQICIQRNSNVGANTSQNWRIKFSNASTFSGGAPGATQVPSAADEVVLLGSGSDAAPTAAQLFGGADAGYRCNVMVDGSAPYGFYLVCFPSGGGSPSAAFIMDPLAANTYTSLDTTPYAFYLDASTTNCLKATDLCSTTLGPTGGLKNGGSISYVRITALALARIDAGVLTQLAPTNVGTNPWTGFDTEFPLVYARKSSEAAPTGFKGWSSFAAWSGGARNTGDTLTVATAGDRIIFGDVSLPWNGSAPTV